MFLAAASSFLGRGRPSCPAAPAGALLGVCFLQPCCAVALVVSRQRHFPKILPGHRARSGPDTGSAPRGASSLGTCFPVLPVLPGPWGQPPVEPGHRPLQAATAGFLWGRSAGASPAWLEVWTAGRLFACTCSYRHLWSTFFFPASWRPLHTVSTLRSARRGQVGRQEGRDCRSFVWFAGICASSVY